MKRLTNLNTLNVLNKNTFFSMSCLANLVALKYTLYDKHTDFQFLSAEPKENPF